MPEDVEAAGVLRRTAFFRDAFAVMECSHLASHCPSQFFPADYLAIRLMYKQRGVTFRGDAYSQVGFIMLGESVTVDWESIHGSGQGFVPIRPDNYFGCSFFFPCHIMPPLAPGTVCGGCGGPTDSSPLQVQHIRCICHS